jgi:hypothetical protein
VNGASWSANAVAGLRDKIQLTSFQRYGGGCVANANYADLASYPSFSVDYSKNEDFLNWPGRKY